MELKDYLQTAHDAGASDIHLIAGEPPVMRVNQVMTPMDFPVITATDAEEMFHHMAGPSTIETFDRVMDADFSYQEPGLSRYRVNAHRQRGMVAIAMRAIKTKVPPLAALNLPEVISRLTYLPRGPVLGARRPGYLPRRVEVGCAAGNRPARSQRPSLERPARARDLLSGNSGDRDPRLCLLHHR